MPRARVKPRHPNRNVSAFLYGVGHAMDLGGILARNRGRFSGGFAADRAALQGDWKTALASARNSAAGQAAPDDGET